MSKKAWYRYVFLGILIVPALLCQTVVPIVAWESWEDLAESWYAGLLSFQTPVPPSKRGAARSPRLAIVTGGPASQQAYGWPLGRKPYTELLGKLKDAGQPWVLALRTFGKKASPLGSGKELTSSELSLRRQNLASDQRWVDAVRAYERYIGSGLEVDSAEDVPELTSLQTAVLLPRITLQSSAGSEAGEGTPRISFSEADDLLDAQHVFGSPPRFEGHSKPYCMRAYEAGPDETLVFPSSLVWATGLAGHWRLFTQGGAEWPRPQDEILFTFIGQLAVTPRHCLASPGLRTADFLAQRQIIKLELVDILEGRLGDAKAGGLKKLLNNRIVILAGEGERLREPGRAQSANDDGSVFDYELAARFLDEFLSGTTIRRLPLQDFPSLHWIPLVLALFIGVASFITTLGQTVLLGFVVMLALVSFGVYHLTVNHIFVLPIQGILYSLIVTLATLAFFMALKIYGLRRLHIFSRNLAASISQCNTIEDIRMAAQKVCAGEFSMIKIFFVGYDAEMYEAAADPRAALVYLRRLSSGDHDVHKFLAERSEEFAEKRTMFATVITSMKKSPQAVYRNFGDRLINAKLAVGAGHRHLGMVDLNLTYQPYEELFIAAMVSRLQLEVSQSWSRVDLLAKQKITEFYQLMQESRALTMMQFLPPALVQQVPDGDDFEGAIKGLLLPRPAQVALLHAHVAGPTRLGVEPSPSETLKLIQSYYKNVVEPAQQVAQVKLSGDSIFLFIEEKSARKEGVSVSDLALHIASLLVRETEKQNRSRSSDDLLNFGIAIHFGAAIVGNLNLEQSIDYTVLGSNVELVERLDELSRATAIQQAVGSNGILLTPAARAHLRLFSDVRGGECDLDRLGLKLRTFTNLRRIFYISKDEALAVAHRSTIKRMSQANLPLTESARESKPV